MIQVCFITGWKRLQKYWLHPKAAVTVSRKKMEKNSIMGKDDILWVAGMIFADIFQDCMIQLVMDKKGHC